MKITFLKSHQDLPGANELNTNSIVQVFIWWTPVLYLMLFFIIRQQEICFLVSVLYVRKLI